MNSGISFMMRVRNEERTLEQSIRSLFTLTIPYEIVVVLHLCTDRSKEIAESLHCENPRIRIFEYTTETSRTGYETLATDASSSHSLMTYYNWCLNKTTLPWVFKWDGDFMASDGLIRFLNGGDWNKLEYGGRYELEAKNSTGSNRELYLVCGILEYVKSLFWETPMVYGIPGDPVKNPDRDDAYILHVSEVVNVKQHWDRVPWYTIEDSEEARTVQARIRRLETEFGKEPHALVRCGNAEMNPFVVSITNANPDYVNIDH